MTFARHKDTSKRSDRKGTQTQNKAQSWRGWAIFYMHVSMSVNVKCTLQSSIKIELW